MILVSLSLTPKRQLFRILCFCRKLSMEFDHVLVDHKKGDLFACPATSSLAHCISADCHMGKGIAVLFKNKFGGVQDLKNQGQKPGGVAILKRQNRYVYYLVTKERYFQKPTYDSLRSSLEAMKTHCIQNKVTELAMPRIGCGLDGLKWDQVEQILTEVFFDSELKITVYTL